MTSFELDAIAAPVDESPEVPGPLEDEPLVEPAADSEPEPEPEPEVVREPEPAVDGALFAGALPGLDAALVADLRAEGIETLEGLAGLILDSLETEGEIETLDGRHTVTLLDSLDWRWAQPGAGHPPLWRAELWDEWDAQRPDEMRDADGLEWARLHAFADTELVGEDAGPRAAELKRVAREVRTWGLSSLPARMTARFANGSPSQEALVIVAESVVAAIEHARGADFDELGEAQEEDRRTGADNVRSNPATKRAELACRRVVRAVDRYVELCGPAEKAAVAPPARADARVHATLQYVTQRLRGRYSSAHPRLPVFLRCVESGEISAAEASHEFFRMCVGPEAAAWENFSMLAKSLVRQGQSDGAPALDPLTGLPALQESRTRVVERILGLELTRGDLPSPANDLLRCTGRQRGMEVLRRAVEALGRAQFSRRLIDAWGNPESRRDALSWMVLHTDPVPGEESDFDAWAKEVPEARLLALAVYAP
ncbi:MAG: DUF5724 domain-containing protein, partial [Planctomycetota bacterium]